MVVRLEPETGDSPAGAPVRAGLRWEALRLWQVCTMPKVAEAIAQDIGAERLMREHMQEYASFVKRRQPALMNEVVGWH
jgi:hypothetical protein